MHHHSNPSPGLPLYKGVQNIQRKKNPIFQARVPVDYLTPEAKKRQKNKSMVRSLDIYILFIKKANQTFPEDWGHSSFCVSCLPSILKAVGSVPSISELKMKLHAWSWELVQCESIGLGKH